MNSILRGNNKILFHKFIYFLAGFIKSLNILSNLQLNYNCELNYVINISFNDIVSFKKNINEIISFKSFISSTNDKIFAENCRRFLAKDRFSTLIIIDYRYNPLYDPDCFDISGISLYPEEKERLFKAFSFFKIIDVKINEFERIANIWLKYIGTSKDFSVKLEKLNKGYNIHYDAKKNILEII